jgi:hypothetical protein
MPEINKVLEMLIQLLSKFASINLLGKSIKKYYLKSFQIKACFQAIWTVF